MAQAPAMDAPRAETGVRRISWPRRVWVSLLKLVLRLGLLTVVACGFVVPFTIGLPNAANRQAVYAQMVDHDPARDSLTGGFGVPIGKPTRYMLTDEKAFLPGYTKDGARYVDHRYLRSINHYPLQVKTVETVCREAQIWCTAVGLIALIVFLTVRGYLDRD
ncbi:MAG: hypothetical protein KIS66_05600 [Fimbriimonadaceae bacterium]|nr:hypothetical protein [Fimbriimonadaceae bacterium]